MFVSYKAGLNSLFYEKSLFINRLINAYLKRSENREYLHLLFGKIMDRLYSANNAPAADVPEEQKRRPTESSLATASLLSPDGPIPKELRRSMTVQSRSALEESCPKETVDWKRTEEICEEFIHSVTKKLIYMPLSVRYLCKLVEKLATANVYRMCHSMMS